MSVFIQCLQSNPDFPSVDDTGARLSGKLKIGGDDYHLRGILGTMLLSTILS